MRSPVRIWLAAPKPLKSNDFRVFFCYCENSVSESSTFRFSQTKSERIPTHCNFENWEEYFVIEYIEKWHTNSFGEIDDLHFDVVIYIKPEYADRVADKENSKVNYDISYDSIVQTIEIDYPSQTYSFTDYWTDQMTFQNIGTWNCIWLTSEHSVIGTSLGYGTINDIPCMGYYENVTVNRIQGTLCLYDE